MKRIVLKPYGGLANRLFAIESAVRLKAEFNCDLKIIWESNRNLGGPFESLFEPSTEFEIVTTEVFKWHKLKSYFSVYNVFDPSHYKYPLLNRLLGQEKKCEVIYYNDPNKKIVFDLDRDRLDLVSSLYLPAHDQFIQAEELCYQPLPNKSLQSRIDAITSDFTKHTIGVHIRRTDHSNAIRNSDDSIFISIMDQLREKGNAFYLATDNLQLKDRLQKRYGVQLITQIIRSTDRQKMEALEDAVVDLFCLSKTSQILGSFESSFSKYAACLRNIPLKLAIDDVESSSS